MSVIVVGAGIAGIACAREVAAAGLPVRVLERARVVGGRMSSRRLAGRPVDLGAAYFTARDPEFTAVVQGWQDAGLVREWTSEPAVLGNGKRGSAPGPVRYAAPGGLRSLVADLATGLDVRLGHEVTRVGPGPVVDGESADTVVLAMPDPQSARLLGTPSPSPEWTPVIAVAAGWSRRRWDDLPVAFVNDHPVLTLVADDGARRGDGAPVLVSHTVADVARDHDTDPDSAVPLVLDALAGLLGVSVEPEWTYAHRWRYASPARDRDEPFHLGDDGIAFAGDGWGTPKVETAWRSGTLLGRALAARASAD
ncbi:NAD(P)/FAD-dependent oxidoreductase [Pseudonocardia abyssalis]|uniref:FAD-dependent oxidoreductase n=1 Tax=Pseudonocardia abyssalis TaxID=2792008 RepID=A0ABS6V1Z6_9PSEU|nr:FAD-dependent oxidoreductase [Pseudonocardia abyssalis]MBW0118903.1 FAD-dependent oxidoreductase [Pseudonocardia abyssalis]MBW0138534.1 FAD-dependent oxidoreductase [Pseudonocardia abyssalis]